MANKIDNFDKFDVSENQARAVDQKKLDSYDVREINSERSALARSIRQATEFNDGEKQYYFEALANEVDDTNLSAIRQYKLQVDKDRQEIRGMIESYTGIINKNRDAFGIDTKRGLDAADEYIEDFMKLDAAGKREWLSALENDIEERMEMLRRAKELMPDNNDYLHTLRRSEVKNLVGEMEKSKAHIREAEKIFADNSEAFSEDEKKELTEQLNDSTRHDQAKIVNGIRSELKERKELTAGYNALPDKYKSLAPGFNTLPLDEKRNAAENVENELTNDYRNLQRSHPLNKHISEDGKDQAYAYFKECDLKDKVGALAKLDSQFKLEQKLSDEFEDLLKKLGKNEKPAKLEKLRLDFYKSDYKKKKEELIPGLKKVAKESVETTTEEKRLTENYKKMLDKAVEKKHIAKITREKSLKKWAKESMDYKRETVDGFEALLAPYTALFERFTALPENLQKGNEAFFEAGFHRKLEMVTRLEEKIESADKNKKPEKAEKKDIESAEKISKKRIQDLTNRATTAERDGEFEDALDYYKEILDMDPDDIIAQSRIKEVKSKTGQSKEKDTTGKDAESALMAEALRQQDVNKQREYFTVLSVAADETKSSEAQHGTIVAAKRQKDSEDWEVAEALEKYTEGSSVLNKEGKAEEILTINTDKDTVSSEVLSGMRRPIVSDIIKSSEQTAAKFIQFKNSSGQKLSGAEGQRQADYIEEQMKANIAGNVADMAERRKIGIDEDKLEEILEKKDLKKLDMAA